MKMFVKYYSPQNEGGNGDKMRHGSKGNQGGMRKENDNTGNRDMNRDTGMGNENDRNGSGRTQKHR